jgi:hypothetical protein
VGTKKVETRILLCASEHRKPRRDGKQIKKLKLKKNVRAESDNDVGISQLKYNKTERRKSVWRPCAVLLKKVSWKTTTTTTTKRDKTRRTEPLRLKESLQRNHNFRR